MKDQFCLRKITATFGSGSRSSSRASRELSSIIISMLETKRRGRQTVDTVPDRPVVAPGNLTPYRSFIDLFAGIGGFRLGLQRLGGRCVFSCEWDRFSAKTYEAWFGESPIGDINEVKPEDIPKHDILAAGFPCQPFSIAGVSKKRSLGQADGFDCKQEQPVAFAFATLLRATAPVLLLENVENLQIMTSVGHSYDHRELPT